MTVADRKTLEYDIIGTCIICNSFGSVVHILKPINFSQTECRIVWKAMDRLWPNDIINLNVLKHQLQSVPTIDYSWAFYLCSITQHAISSFDLVTSAFLLLEIDFKKKFLDLMQQQRIKKTDFRAKTVIDEIISETQHPEADIFDHVNVCAGYLRTHKMNELAGSVEQLSDQIDHRIKDIDLINRREILISELRKLDNEEMKRKEFLKRANRDVA